MTTRPNGGLRAIEKAEGESNKALAAPAVLIKSRRLKGMCLFMIDFQRLSDEWCYIHTLLIGEKCGKLIDFNFR